jgi:uncharacterized protein YjbI with pentapeptide repeats
MEGASLFSATLTSTLFDDSDLKNAIFKGVRVTDGSTVDSLLKAKTLERANFSGVIGIDPIQLCQMLKAGAVMVDKEKEWSADGRQQGNMEQYMSEADKAASSKCAT